MNESYPDGEGSGAVDAPSALAGATMARGLLTQLLPSVNSELLVTGLLAERLAPLRDLSLPEPRESELDQPARELRRVRTLLALGEAARPVQHAMNNPLTALLAEAQLLELEPLADDHRLAVGRIVDLARRIAKVTRRLDLPAPPRE